MTASGSGVPLRSLKLDRVLIFEKSLMGDIPSEKAQRRAAVAETEVAADTDRHAFQLQQTAPDHVVCRKCCDMNAADANFLSDMK